MVNPKKISEEARALTCDEYDENLDILQNRANHVGFQSCTTLSDLDSCLTTNSVITTINQDINNNSIRITQLEDDLSGTGTIANDLSVLEATLRSEIQQNTSDVNVVNNTIDNELRFNINSNDSEIASLNQTINNNFNNLNPRLTALDDDANQGRMIRAEQDISLLQTQLNSVTNNIIPTETTLRSNADNSLDIKINTEIQDRTTEISRVESIITDEVNDRIQSVNTVDQKFDIITNNTTTLLNNEIQDRVDADLLIQTQINSLSSSLSGAIPTGTILAYAGISPPPGFLYCNGDSISRTNYPNLFSVISTRYGSSNSSSFNIPDLRDRTVFGSLSNNLNSNPTYQFSNLKSIEEPNLPSHTHSSSLTSHSHTVDTNHFHGLYIHDHNHPIGNLPDHTHSLAPYRMVSLGGGNEDDIGAELTNVQSDDPDEGNIFPNTPMNGPIPGPAVGASTVGIYPPPFTGINRTDDGGGVLNTSQAGSSLGTTGSTGGSVLFDVRQSSLSVNFIIKT